MNETKSINARNISRESALFVLIVVTLVLCWFLFPVSFRKWENFNAILRNLPFEGFLAIGMMFMLVGGVFDLSVGAMASMTGVVTGWLMKSAGWPVPAAIAGGLALAAVGGLANGLIVAKIRVNALITTLGTMFIFKGIAVLVGGPGIAFLPESFTRVGQAEWLGVQSPVWLLLLLALVAHYLLAHTRFFRQYYYIGSNAKAAHLSGIPVERLQVVAFTIMGVIAGLAGILYAARSATANSAVGDNMELRAITAAILGGASLTGGKGKIVGALLGVFFLALLDNILIIANVPSELQRIIRGAVLVLAVAIDGLWNRRGAG
jgi:ribose/xylose/arabinose/galactoside ABC-type transport system permease subunit